MSLILRLFDHYGNIFEDESPIGILDHNDAIVESAHTKQLKLSKELFITIPIFQFENVTN